MPRGPFLGALKNFVFPGQKKKERDESGQEQSGGRLGSWVVRFLSFNTKWFRFVFVNNLSTLFFRCGGTGCSPARPLGQQGIFFFFWKRKFNCLFFWIKFQMRLCCGEAVPKLFFFSGV